MKENDTITEGRAAVSSNETKRTAEGYYYVAPGSSVTLVGLGLSGRYWWMGGDNPYGGTCKVVSGEFSGIGDGMHFTALARCTGGYLFVQGPHRVLKSCGDSIAEVISIKGRQLEPKYSYGITKMLHAPGSVAVVDGDIRMFDSYGVFSVVDSKVGGCRLYGHVSDSYDAAAPDTPVQPGKVAKGYKEFVKSRERSNSLAGYECGHLVSVDKRKELRAEEHARRNENRYNSIDTSSCKVYCTRDDERWVFFSHNGCAKISPLESDGQAYNTFRTEFVEFNKGMGIPYVCVDGGRMYALRGEHSAFRLSGPVLDRSKLFQVYPSKIEGEHDFWRMVYTRPDRYRLLVVPMSGGAVVQKDRGSLLDEPDILAHGTPPLNGPCLMSGSYKSITVLSGECMVFAIHESLKLVNHDRYNGFDAVVNDDDGTLWLPMLHNTSFQWNRESRDASFVHHLCVGIPHDIAPDETAVALYHLGKGRGIIRAVGGDVYYSLETYNDAYNIMHADGRIEAGNAVVVDTGEYTGIALYGPHDIRPLEEGQSPDKGDGVCLVVKPDLEMHYGGGDDGSVVSVRIDGNMVDLPKGYRRSKERSIRYAAREILFREECDRNKAREQEAKEPPCHHVSELEDAKVSVKVSKNGSALDVTVSLPDRFAHREYADIVLEGVYSICTKLQEIDKRNAS